MSVQKVLQIDAAHRHDGVQGDIFSLSTVRGQESWDYSQCTLCSGNEYDSNSRRYHVWQIPSIEEFKKLFYKMAPLLKEIDMSNLLIAGGSIGDLIVRRLQSTKDIDVFVHGLKNEVEATQRVKKFLEDLVAAYLQSHAEEEKKREAECKERKQRFMKRDPHHPHFLRNRNGVAVKIHNLPLIQVIFRLYNSPSEVLHGFDLGSSAVGFNGEDVLFTTLSKFAYEFRVNIIDTTRRSTTYEARLIKYFHRGFEIIVPNLDISKLRTKYHKYNLCEVADLPKMPFSYKRISGNRIHVDRFLQEYPESSDYQLDDLAYEPYKVLALNLRQLLLDGKPNLMHLWTGFDTQILDRGPHITFKMVESYYDSMTETMYKEGKLNVRALKRDITIQPVMESMKKMFGDKEYSTSSLHAALEEMVKQQKLKIHELLVPILEGSQLTSSINPIMEKPEEWYGDLWKA